MKIITNAKQKEIDKEVKNKLRFVAIATIRAINCKEVTDEKAKQLVNIAEDVFYADAVIT